MTPGPSRTTIAPKVMNTPVLPPARQRSSDPQQVEIIRLLLCAGNTPHDEKPGTRIMTALKAVGRVHRQMKPAKDETGEPDMTRLNGECTT